MVGVNRFVKKEPILCFIEWCKQYQGHGLHMEKKTCLECGDAKMEELNMRICQVKLYHDKGIAKSYILQGQSKRSAQHHETGDLA